MIEHHMNSYEDPMIKQKTTTAGLKYRDKAVRMLGSKIWKTLSEHAKKSRNFLNMV